MKKTIFVCTTKDVRILRDIAILWLRNDYLIKKKPT